ncbi:hypothetical protein IKE84_02190 [Candidatus Saccharibacteria bacterium]|nr:hypothetical protein [Candidatus Saccharibacteria bacterium]
MEKIILFLAYLNKISKNDEIFLLPEYQPPQVRRLIDSNILNFLKKTLDIDYEIANPLSLDDEIDGYYTYKLDFKKDWAQLFTKTKLYPPYSYMPEEKRLAINLNGLDIQKTIKNVQDYLQNQKEPMIILDPTNNIFHYKNKTYKPRKDAISYRCLKKLFQNPDLEITCNEILANSTLERKTQSIYDTCRNMNNRLKKELGLENDILIMKNSTVKLAEEYKNRVKISQSI